jgi:hypothetical protein
MQNFVKVKLIKDVEVTISTKGNDLKGLEGEIKDNIPETFANWMVKEGLCEITSEDEELVEKTASKKVEQIEEEIPPAILDKKKAVKKVPKKKVISSKETKS